MITTTNIHNVKSINVPSYNHDINAINITFHIDDGSGSILQITAFGIKPKEAMIIMSILGDDKTRVYIDAANKALSRDQYMEEITVLDVLEKMEENDET